MLLLVREPKRGGLDAVLDGADRTSAGAADPEAIGASSPTAPWC